MTIWNFSTPTCQMECTASVIVGKLTQTIKSEMEKYGDANVFIIQPIYLISMFILFNRSIPLTEWWAVLYTSSMFLAPNVTECEGQVRNGLQLAGVTRRCSILTVIDYLCLGFARIQQRSIYTLPAPRLRDQLKPSAGVGTQSQCATRFLVT